MLFITLLGSAVTLATLVPLRHFFHPLEIFAYWAFVASIDQLIFTILTLNLNVVQYDGKLMAFWNMKQASLIIIPIAILWCLAIADRVRGTPLKVTVCILTAGILATTDYIYMRKGYFIFTHWSLVSSVILYLGEILIAALFKLGFRTMMRRGKVVR